MSALTRRPRFAAAAFALAAALAMSAPADLAAQQTQPQQQPQQKRPPTQQPATKGPQPKGQATRPGPPSLDALPPSQIGIGTLAKQAYMVDMTTGAILLWKDADRTMVPSSMVKMMTAYIVFEELKAGRLKPDSRFRVSERAYRMGGSRMFLEVNREVAIDDLLKGIIVHSGNDACVVLAEGLAGTEEAFAERMTKKARELGMAQTVFRNSSGWPAEGQVSTARDMAILSQRTIEDFPEHYRYYAMTDYVFNDIRQENRNRLLRIAPGTDGLKTGHTEEAGYGLASSTIRDGRRIVLVVNGLASMDERAREAARLTEWGFREFSNTVVLRPGDKALDAKVWLGQSETVPLVAPRMVAATTPVGQQAAIKVTATYEGPLKAPIAKGQELGKITVALPGGKSQDYPLLAGADVPRLGPVGRTVALLRHYLFGWMA